MNPTLCESAISLSEHQQSHRMKYIAHTAHLQFLGLIEGILAWILIMATVGLNEWRLWHVADESVITSGIAWVGIWRVCFYSHVLPKIENCQSISIADHFVPAEIPVAQVLMLLGVICGLAANISAAVAMRMVYFSVEDRRKIRLVFMLAGTLYVVTSMSCLVPLGWNMNSVLNNSTIDFPPEFHLPTAPVRQQVGSAIGVGIFASILMLISGLLFLCYRYAWQALSSEPHKDTKDPLHGPWTETTLTPTSELPNRDYCGRDNPAFHTEEAS
uniref:claudin-34 n=1 Tax=Scatophagus argus TaxID=75038 RepID=UPI001ED7CC36|nr:claudin-34 [Scatophagus argus]